MFKIIMYTYLNNNLVATCEQMFDSFCGALTRFTKNEYGFTKFKLIDLELNKTIVDNFKKEKINE